MCDLYLLFVISAAVPPNTTFDAFMAIMESDNDNALFPVNGKGSYGRVQGAVFALLMQQLVKVWDRIETSSELSYKTLAQMFAQVINGNGKLPLVRLKTTEKFIVILIKVW